MRPTQFIKLWLTTFVSSLLVMAISNIVIDPYNLWNSPRIQGVSLLKPASGTHSRLSKPHQLRHFKANTLIMGNSRPEMGLNPGSSCWPDNFKPVYNQATPGVSLYQQLRLLQHASFFHKPAHIIVAIDFNDFLRASPYGTIQWPPARDIENLSVDSNGQANPDYSISLIRDYLKASLSLKALTDSLYTLAAQSEPYSSNLTAAGYNTAQDYLKIIANEGQHVLFLQKNQAMLKRFSQTLYLFNQQNWSQYFETYQQLLSYAQTHGIDVSIIINPYHSDYLEIIRSEGLWPQFLQWKKTIAQISLRNKSIRLWDFSLVNAFTSEIPTLNGQVNSRIHWFWEPAHYTSDYGDLILEQILNSSCQTNSKHFINQQKLCIAVSNTEDYMQQLSNQENLLKSTLSVSRIAKLRDPD